MRTSACKNTSVEQASANDGCILENGPRGTQGDAKIIPFRSQLQQASDEGSFAQTLHTLSLAFGGLICGFALWLVTTGALA